MRTWFQYEMRMLTEATVVMARRMGSAIVIALFMYTFNQHQFWIFAFSMSEKRESINDKLLFYWCSYEGFKANAHFASILENEECQNAMLWCFWHPIEFRIWTHTIHAVNASKFNKTEKEEFISQPEHWHRGIQQSCTKYIYKLMHGTHTVISIFPHCLPAENRFDPLCNWAPKFIE